MNYFRTTAYNKTENYSVILDSYGAFDAIWQFSSFLTAKAFLYFPSEIRTNLTTEIYLK